MKYYKIDGFLCGKPTSWIQKGISKQNALQSLKANTNGNFTKITQIDTPLKIKCLKVFAKFKHIFNPNKIDYFELSNIFKQLYYLTKTNSSLQSSFKVITLNTNNITIQNIFKDITTHLNKGLDLYEAFELHSNKLTKLPSIMMKVAQKNGKIYESCLFLSQIYFSIATNKQELKKALRYPIGVFLSMGIAFAGLSVYVVPQFEEIFNNLHIKLPLATQILITTKNIIIQYHTPTLFILFGAYLTHTILNKKSYFYKFSIDYIKIHIYPFSNILSSSIKYQSLSILSRLFFEKHNIIESLALIQDLNNNIHIQKQIKQIIKGVENGKTLSESIQKYKFLDNIALQMIKTGEETGEITSMLENASLYYKNKFDNNIKTLISLIEPIMIIISGGLILLLALGVFLPIWNLAGGINQ